MNMNINMDQQPSSSAIVPLSTSSSSPSLSLTCVIIRKKLCKQLSCVISRKKLCKQPPRKIMSRKKLCKQLSMCETRRDVAWEKRRRQIMKQERMRNMSGGGQPRDDMNLTDEDLHELKGCIELGFGFNEEDGQRLCPTLPALDLYFAVNRQFSSSPLSSPGSSRHSTSSMGGPASSFGASSSSSSFVSASSPKNDSDGWKMCTPGDNPQQVKTKLRHWAQAVACSVMQFY